MPCPGIEERKMTMETEIVKCVKCGHEDQYPIGYLTEKASKEYKCSACRQVVVELSAQEREIGKRKLLVEG